jgi:putative SOS response-associated peptidase YedK
MCRWKIAETEASILTLTITTRAAEGAAAAVHTRMPLILPKEAEAARMDSQQTDRRAALDVADAAAITCVDL